METKMHFSRCGAMVDLGAVRRNMEAFAAKARSHHRDIRLMAVVKADGYGHGAAEVANAIRDQADMFAVASTDEGIHLRQAGGIQKPILILGPTFAEDDEDCFDFGLTTTLFDTERAKQLNDNIEGYIRELSTDYKQQREDAAGKKDTAGEIVALLRENERRQRQAAAAEEAARKAARAKEQGRSVTGSSGGDGGLGLDKAANAIQSAGAEASYAFSDHKAHVHIAVDTGMSRIGLTPDEKGLAIVKAIAALPYIRIDGVFTHFATADEGDLTGAREALERFRHFRSLCDAAGLSLGIWHCANTAAILQNLGLEYDMARVGIGLYGMYPSEEVPTSDVRLKPAIMWYSFLTQVKTIPAGTSVSYGYRFTADQEMRIGTVCTGYADGYPRALSGQGAEVLVNGRRCPVLGRICMDQMMIDVSAFGENEIRPGTPVILLGSMGGTQVTAEELAEKCGTISYEIVCGISPRVPRKYVGA